MTRPRLQPATGAELEAAGEFLAVFAQLRGERGDIDTARTRWWLDSLPAPAPPMHPTPAQVVALAFPDHPSILPPHVAAERLDRHIRDCQAADALVDATRNRTNHPAASAGARPALAAPSTRSGS